MAKMPSRKKKPYSVIKETMFVWKKAVIKNPSYGDSFKGRILVKLRLAKGTPVHWEACAGFNKCRAAKATVVAFYSMYGKPYQNDIDVRSLHDLGFKYSIGKVIRPKRAFCQKPKICASGIHFFRKRSDARNYFG